MYPSNGRGHRRAPPPAQPPDATYGNYYNPNQTPTRSPQPPSHPNGVHGGGGGGVDSFQSPQPDAQQGYTKYPYDNYAPSMPQQQQYPPTTSPHHTPYSNHGQAQMGQQNHQGQGMQMHNSTSGMSGNSHSGHSIGGNAGMPSGASVQSQFYASAWEQNSPAPVYPQPPQPNGMGGGGGNRRSVPQPLPPTNFYNPNAHNPAGNGSQNFSTTYAPPAPQAPPASVGGGGGGGFSVPALQNAVPLMMAGMRMASGASPAGANGAPAADVAALGAHLFQQFTPGANNYLHTGREHVTSFMRLPKYYFTVNHSYVLRKLLLLLKPWGTRTWARQRAVDPSQFSSGSDGTTSYLPPRDDVNAPDLYIPVMAFATYVLLVGFMHGIRQQFNAELLARHFSKGAGVLVLEAVMIKLGLYLINARATPWLDVIAYRGYKFVGVAATMAVSILAPRLYWVSLFYASSMMGLFLMRSHRRIVMPREAVNNPAEVARRNAFLLFLCALQYPIYWILVTY